MNVRPVLSARLVDELERAAAELAGEGIPVTIEAMDVARPEQVDDVIARGAGAGAV